MPGGRRSRGRRADRTFGPRAAVDGLTFGAPRGTVTGLLGPNGCGKSTTMKVDSHHDQDVRGVLSCLAAMAERNRCCVLLPRHLNKSAGGSARYRGGGSIGIIGAGGTVGLSDLVISTPKINLSALAEAAEGPFE